MQNVLQDLRFMAETCHVDLRVEQLPQADVRADRKGLRRAFINVIDNALKYTNEGGHILISATRERPGMISIMVKDDGRGISKEALPHVFERFYKADEARHTTGSGLGLSIVKELIESYGGAVTIQSSLGRGTTFVIHLKEIPAFTQTS